MSPVFKSWCLVAYVLLSIHCGVGLTKSSKTQGPVEKSNGPKLITKDITDNIVNPLSRASIGLANKALAQVDKYVEYAVEKYHGKQPPKRVLSKNRNTKRKPSVFNPHPRDILNRILEIDDDDNNNNGFRNINGVKNGFPGQELSNSENLKQRPDVPNPKSNGRFFKNIGNNGKFNFSGIKIINGVVSGLPDEEQSNSGNSKQRPKKVLNPKSNGEFFSNFGNDDGYGEVPKSDDVISGLPDEELSNSGNSKRRPKKVLKPKSNVEFFSNFGNDDGYGEVTISDAAKANIEEIRAANKLK